MKLLMLILLLSVGCSTESEEVTGSEVQVLNGEDISGARLTQNRKELFLNSIGSKGARQSQVVLTQSYELAPPTIDGLTLQATSVSKRSERIMVTYNFQGETYKGGLDYLVEDDEDLAIESQVLFQNADVNYAEYFSNNLYLVGATENQTSPSYVHEFEVQGKGLRDTGVSTNLGSYAANSADRSGNFLYVTTGDDVSLGGGLYKMDFDLNVLSYAALEDARWIHHDNKKLFVAQGTPGRISVFDEKSFNFVSTIAVDGANEAQAKTTLDYADGYIYFAAGTKGLKVFDEDSGELVADISFDNEASVSNAVSVEDDLAFVSNGEAGIYVLEISSQRGTIDISTIGWFNFGDGISANHIHYERDRLFVASGLAGTRVIEIGRL